MKFQAQVLIFCIFAFSPVYLMAMEDIKKYKLEEGNNDVIISNLNIIAQDNEGNLALIGRRHYSLNSLLNDEKKYVFTIMNDDEIEYLIIDKILFTSAYQKKINDIVGIIIKKINHQNGIEFGVLINKILFSKPCLQLNKDINIYNIFETIILNKGK